MHDPNNTLYFFLGRLWQQNVSVILGPVETCVHEVNNNQSQLAQALQQLVVTHVQARMAAAFNLPMLSYYCQHAETSDKVAFPTFIRTRWEPTEFFFLNPRTTRYVCDQLRIIFEIFFSPPASFISKSVASLLLEFSWKTVALFHPSAEAMTSMMC